VAKLPHHLKEYFFLMITEFPSRGKE
jgi:hypothetical protein